MPVVTLQGNIDKDYDWIGARPAVINLVCDCLWDQASGDLRALPDCPDHSRDIWRYGTGLNDGDENTHIPNPADDGVCADL